MADMTDMLEDEVIDPVTGEIIVQKDLAGRLLVQARGQGGEFGRAGRVVESAHQGNVLEVVLNAELTELLGYEHGGTLIEVNMRNGTRVRTVLTEVGPVEIGGSP